MKLKKILVPTDFSAAAEQALDYAADLARLGKGEIVLLFAVEPMYATPTDLYGASVAVGTLLTEQMELGRRHLAQLAAKVKRRRLRTTTKIETGTAWEVIVDQAAKTAADLIVMATHGYTGITHFLLGSVTEKVVRTAGCPVLTLRIPGTARSGRRSKVKTRRRR